MVWIPWLVGWTLWLAPSAEVCRVQLEGIPAPLLRHHAVQVGAVRVSAAAVVDVPSSAGSVAVLRGLRYEGAVRLPARCDAPVILHAAPRPARLEVSGTPSHAVLSCLNCPGVDAKANFLSDVFPSFIVKDWSTQVTLWIRAPGYDPVFRTMVLHPGPNEVELAMSPRA